MKAYIAVQSGWIHHEAVIASESVAQVCIHLPLILGFGAVVGN